MVQQAPEESSSFSDIAKSTQESILIIDSVNISFFADIFVNSSFIVKYVQNIRDLDTIIEAKNYDLVIINTNLPNTDGINVLRRLAAYKYLPGILVCTEAASEVDRIVALEIGADDIVDKSYSSREILARARAILRRISSESARENRVHTPGIIKIPSTGFKFLGWFLDCRRMMIFTPAGLKVDLTSAEFLILNELMRDPGVVKGRAELASLRTDDLNEDNLRSIDTNIGRIRRKLSQHDSRTIVETVRGRGYRSTPYVDLV